ncbi:hypothetical protein D3C78_717640 [compost metagenome]
MSNKDTITHKFNKLTQHWLKIRSILNHFIRNIGQLLNMIRDLLMRINKSRITVYFFAFAHFNGRQLRNIIAGNR